MNYGGNTVFFKISGHFNHLISSVGRTERSALKVLREQLFAHKSDLIGAFKKFDRNNTGASRLTERLSPLRFMCEFFFYYASLAFLPLVPLKVRVALWGGNVSSCFCPLQFTPAHPAVSQKLLFTLTQRINRYCARFTYSFILWLMIKSNLTFELDKYLEIFLRPLFEHMFSDSSTCLRTKTKGVSDPS